MVKEKVGSKIYSAAWSPDGSLLVIGLENGTVSIRNQKSVEVQKLDLKGPVWCLNFLPGNSPIGGHQKAVSSSNFEGDLLVIGCWDKTLSLYR